jgi:hypothetical protein
MLQLEYGYDSWRTQETDMKYEIINIGRRADEPRFIILRNGQPTNQEFKTYQEAEKEVGGRK